MPLRYNHCCVRPGTAEIASVSWRTTNTVADGGVPGFSAPTAESQPWNAFALGLCAKSRMPLTGNVASEKSCEASSFRHCATWLQLSAFGSVGTAAFSLLLDNQLKL